MEWAPSSTSEVEARVYVAPAPAVPVAGASNPVSGWSDRAQGAFVAGIAAKTGNASAFRDAITKGKPDGAGGGSFGTVDGQKRLLVVTLTRPAGYVPGDRIARVVVRIQPINFSLGGYTIAQTDRQTIDVTALTRTAGLEEDLSVGAPTVAPVAASAGLKATQGSSSVTKLTESPEKLTVDVVPACMRIVEEGAHGVDLTGNIKIAATLLTETAPIPGECDLAPPADTGFAATTTGESEFFVADPGLAFKAGRPRFERGSPGGALRAFPAHPLIAKVTLDYVLRRVIAGARSYDEGVQDVRLVPGRAVTCQVILPISQAMPPLYALYGPAPDPGHLGDVVTVGPGDGSILAFTTMDAARNAAEWFKTGPRTFGTTRIATPFRAVSAQRYGILGGSDQCREQAFTGAAPLTAPR